MLPYDPEWPREFQRIRNRLRRLFPGARIEHIGSTSVPGCAAKPIIDISLGLAPGSSVRDSVFRAAGLTFRSVQPYSIVFAISRPDGSRAANVHVRYRGTEAELSDLRFRDFLRSHPEVVWNYVETKREAIASSRDGADYTRAKAPFIERVQESARRWAKKTRRAPAS